MSVDQRPSADSTSAPTEGYESEAQLRWLDRPNTKWVLRASAFVVLIIVWQWYASGVSKALFATPTLIAEAFYKLTFVENEMLVPVLESLLTLIVGLMAAVVVGIPVGILMGRSKIAHWALDPYVTFLYVLPTIALIPLLIVWLGFELKLRLVMVFLSGVFPIIINTTAGVKNVDAELLDIGRSFTASEKQIVNTIVLPSAVPFMFAGLRIAFGAAFVGVIVAEMTASLAGLGGMILVASERFQTAEMFVPIIYIMIIGLSLNGTFNGLQGRLSHWQKDKGAI